MGQLADKVRSDLQREFFRGHKKLFILNLPEYCRECKQYVEKNCRQRLQEYRDLYKKGRSDPSDFL